MNFLGLYRHVRSPHAKSLTGEMYVSLGMNSISGRDLYAEGGLIALAEGKIRNQSALVKALKLSADAPMGLIVNRAYRYWGADYVRRIEGSVMTAVIDRAEERMLLSADRTGAVPVFYTWKGRSAAFASHPGLLLNAGACGRIVDKAGLRELMLSGGAYTPGRTPFRDIRLLEPGCVLLADARGTRIKRYDSQAQALSDAFAARSALPCDEALSRFLEEAFPKEAGVLLAGGLSEPIAKLLHARGEARTYSAGSCRPSNPCYSHTNFEPAADDILSYLGECNLALGYPGRGLRDCALYSLMKRAFSSEECVFLGGMRLFHATDDAMDAADFLKEEVKLMLDAEHYSDDRLNPIRDRFHLPMENEQANAFCTSACRFLLHLPSYLAGIRLFSEYLGGKAASPLSDERFVKACFADQRPRKCESAGPFSENGNAPGAAEIYEECRRLTADSTQPLYAFIDSARVAQAIEDRQAQALSRLAQINLWMNQYETEIRLA